jgi:hypothetical protein
MPYKDPEYMKKWRAANKDKIAAYNHEDHVRRQQNPAHRESKRQAAARWYARNTTRIKQAKRAYYDANKNQWRNSAFRRKYGITLADYEKLLAAQQNRCAICSTLTPGGRGEHFHVDHDHATGVVRGLLCHNCNLGVGSFKDQPERLEAAATYLRTRGSARVAYTTANTPLEE